MNLHDDPRDLRWITNADNQKRRRQDQARRDEENEQQHARREEPGVIEYKSIQRVTATKELTRGR